MFFPLLFGGGRVRAVGVGGWSECGTNYVEGGRVYIISFKHYFQYTSCVGHHLNLCVMFFPHSLQELLQSSRTLSLKLLDFIMEWQVHGLGIFLMFLGQSKGH